VSSCRRHRALIIPFSLLIVGVGAACSKSSSTPTTPSPGGSATIAGQVLDGATNQPVPGAAIHIDGVGDVTGAGDGSFAFGASTASAALRAVMVTSPSTIDRSTWAVLPGTSLTVTLMPASLDLTAFNQMFRGNNGELHRWTSAPAAVLQRRALRFTTVNDSSYVATASVMADSQADAILGDLAWAMPQLSANVFPAFSSVQRETAAEGEVVATNRPGTVVVALTEGLTATTGFAGYTRWAWNGAGEMLQAVIVFDRNFDSSATPYRRAVRAHELGHALGYNHVTARPSVMDPSGTIEPNQFDRDGARIAFLRPILNRSPDADPKPAINTSARSNTVTWTGAP